MERYPKCFPDNFETAILPKEAKKENKRVYRIIKYGIDNRDSYVGTYEEMCKGLIPRKKRIDLTDPSLYSTSCNIEYDEAEYVLDIMMRHHPKAVIAMGETEGKCGPCQLTANREPDNHSSHVDWWIYEDAEPQKYFQEVADNE